MKHIIEFKNNKWTINGKHKLNDFEKKVLKDFFNFTKLSPKRLNKALFWFYKITRNHKIKNRTFLFDRTRTHKYIKQL